MNVALVVVANPQPASLTHLAAQTVKNMLPAGDVEVAALEIWGVSRLEAGASIRVNVGCQLMRAGLSDRRMEAPGTGSGLSIGFEVGGLNLRLPHAHLDLANHRHRALQITGGELFSVARLDCHHF